MIYMILEISCLIFKKKHFFFNFHFLKTVIFGYFWFLAKKHPKITKVVQKTNKIINLPYYPSNFIKKKSTFWHWPFFSDLWHGIAHVKDIYRRQCNIQSVANILRRNKNHGTLAKKQLNFFGDLFRISTF